MLNIFETFKPENSLIKPHVSYYYLDIKPGNTTTRFECFPHYNNSISLYNSHFRDPEKNVVFQPGGSHLQIFTPLRETILRVTQIGPVHRIVIVFNPLGIFQFFRDVDFTRYVLNFNFLEQQELDQLFKEKNPEQLTFLLDQMLLQRFHKYENSVLECALRQILSDHSGLTIENLSQTLSISRRHLNRLFQTHFGVSVKRFCNIVAFRKAITAKISENSHISLTELAYEYGYADQAHLSKNIRAFTQKAPRLFFAQGKKLGDEDIFWHFHQ